MYLNANFQPKQINKDFVLIRIDRQKQAAKRGKVGSILIPVTAVHQQYNLQIGEVLMVGETIKKLIPEMAAGDNLLFHHSIEGQFFSASENKHKQIGQTWDIYNNEHIDPQWIYYIVRQDFIYGIQKPDGAIICNPEIMFAIAAPDEEDNRGLVRKGTLYLFQNFKEERADIEKRLAAMKREAETHPERAEHLMKEMEAVTKSLNKKRAGAFLPVFIGANIQKRFSQPIDSTYSVWYEFLGSKSTVPQVTTITVENVTFYVLRSDYILMAKKLKEFSAVFERNQDSVKMQDFVSGRTLTTSYS